jgi:diacylglycerol O-acyltransferase / wax synthase
MPLPMSPTDALFLLVESREHPMHVGGLQLFRPPDGADTVDAHRMYQSLVATHDIAPTFRKRARRTLSSAGQWAWEPDDDFDIEHHVRHNALPKPGRVLELLGLCSRLHSTLLDRHRPLWEAHLIEGLADGRLAMYFKIHHSVMDGVTSLRVMQQSLSRDAAEVDMPPPWVDRSTGDDTEQALAEDWTDRPLAELSVGAARTALGAVGEAAGLPATLIRTLQRGLREEAASISFAAPRTILNVPITGARRVAAQSWPMERIRLVAKASHGTVNDVVLAMSSGALRSYLHSLDALPKSPLIAMVPVALRTRDVERQSGNAVGAVMCKPGHSPARRRRPARHRAPLDDRREVGTVRHDPDPDSRHDGDRHESARAQSTAPPDERGSAAVQLDHLEHSRSAASAVLERPAAGWAVPVLHSDRWAGAEHHHDQLRRPARLRADRLPP